MYNNKTDLIHIITISRVYPKNGDSSPDNFCLCNITGDLPGEAHPMNYFPSSKVGSFPYKLLKHMLCIM